MSNIESKCSDIRADSQSHARDFILAFRLGNARGAFGANYANDMMLRSSEMLRKGCLAYLHGMSQLSDVLNSLMMF